MRALDEVHPKFGADSQELSALYANGIVPYGSEFEDVRVTLGRLVEQTRVSEKTPIMSVRCYNNSLIVGNMEGEEGREGNDKRREVSI